MVNVYDGSVKKKVMERKYKGGKENDKYRNRKKLFRLKLKRKKY